MRDWEERHIAVMRTIRHECFVAGCIGSEPLCWVPTESELEHARRVRLGLVRAIDFPAQLVFQHEDRWHWDARHSTWQANQHLHF